MARRRMIDPKIWKSEDFGTLTILARMLFIGMFSLADDEGRGQASPAFLRANIFAYDDGLRLADVDKALQEVGNKMSVELYAHMGKQYYSLTRWKKWQVVNRPYSSQLPPPPSSGVGGELQNCGISSDNSVNAHSKFSERSVQEVKEEVQVQVQVKESKEETNQKKTHMPISGEMGERASNSNSDSDQELAVIEKAFGLFWDSYPRKVSKKEAHDKFTRLFVAIKGANKKPNREKFWKAVYDGLQYSKFQWEEEERPADKIPYPATWLNKEMYKDRLEFSEYDFDGGSGVPDEINDFLKG